MATDGGGGEKHPRKTAPSVNGTEPTAGCWCDKEPERVDLSCNEAVATGCCISKDGGGGGVGSAPSSSSKYSSSSSSPKERFRKSHRPIDGVAGRGTTGTAVPLSLWPLPLVGSSVVNTIAFCGVARSNPHEDVDARKHELDAAPAVETGSSAFCCNKLSVCGSYGTEVPVRMISSSSAVVLSVLVEAVVTVLAVVLVAVDVFFLLRRVR